MKKQNKNEMSEEYYLISERSKPPGV